MNVSLLVVCLRYRHICVSCPMHREDCACTNFQDLIFLDVMDITMLLCGNVTLVTFRVFNAHNSLDIQKKQHHTL